MIAKIHKNTKIPRKILHAAKIEAEAYNRKSQEAYEKGKTASRNIHPKDVRFSDIPYSLRSQLFDRWQEGFDGKDIYDYQFIPNME